MGRLVNWAAYLLELRSVGKGTDMSAAVNVRLAFPYSSSDRTLLGRQYSHSSSVGTGSHDIDELYTSFFKVFINLGLIMTYTGRNKLPTFEIIK
jgi:hypothetical protein